MLLILVDPPSGAPAEDGIHCLYFSQSNTSFGMEALNLVFSCGFEQADTNLLTLQAKEKKPKGRGIALDTTQELEQH